MIQLRELKLNAIAKTYNAEEIKKHYYILLRKNNQFYTVFSTEKGGMIMTGETKKILVDLLFEPSNENKDLVDCKYPDEYEKYRRKAIHLLINYESKPNKTKLSQQAKEVLSETQEKLLNELFKLHQEAITATPNRRKKYHLILSEEKYLKKLNGLLIINV
ncbi:hypothetical protein FC093_07985 [Ilyomonas limi]|uniref:Uncharacterized protein n=1 Tax=Ilyomonas limi TaxID=2575867 RepID=A0A4U3L2K3_9BACT|nr:hypothetical protein [Ilyomonas limi]TKK69248.1 hypothetical protein FC093_07985 [Ilyomonas limi]